MFLNGITIVLCGNADRFDGAAIAWATKVERDHAMVSLPKHAAVTHRIAEAKKFSISVLSTDQAHIPRQYGGQKQSDPQDIEPSDLDFARWGVPVIKHARGQLLCKVRETLAIKAQVVVIARIVESVFSEHLEPLAYNHRDYFST